MRLSARYEEAFVYANHIHGDQIRRKTGMPRMAHLLAVSGLVLEHGGTEDEAVAALLHDAVEDAGGPARLSEIQARFGQAIAQIVDGCSEPQIRPKPPWRERKQAYLDHLSRGSPSVMLVSAADKLHNARALWRDFRSHGEAVWERYRGGKEGTLWYYSSLLSILRGRTVPELVDELQHVVTELENLAEPKP